MLYVFLLFLAIGLSNAEEKSASINLSADVESTITKLSPAANIGFGFSVSIHSDSNDTKWLMVSAPLSNIDAPNKLTYSDEFGEPNRPGSVFRCPFSGNPTNCVLLEFKFETEQGIVKANASHMLLGHSIVSASSGSTGFRSPVPPNLRARHSAACAPLLKSSQSRPVGSCVLWDSTFRPKVLKTRLSNIEYADYRNMFGFSSASYGHTNADIFVFGVPGHATVYSGGDDYRATDQGGIVIEIVEQRRTVEHRILGFNPTPFEAYAGFSVALSDIFSNDAPNVITIVVGAPRAGNLTGRVYFIEFDISTQQETRLEDRTIVGSDEVPMGSQFGYALLPVDFNADGFVDLLVSAPFAFDRNQQRFGGLAQGAGSISSVGAVLAYLNLPDQSGARSLSVANPVVIAPPNCASEGTIKTCSSQTRDGLFGLSLATPGDIDGDGIFDVAVGAPGENNGKGAVYIYRGSSSGLVFASRLEPKTPGGRYFGFSLAGGNMDVDENGYPDLVVGSFAADRVWVLRSRPVVRIQATLSNSTGRRFLLLDQNWPTTFKLCLDMSSPAPLLRSTALEGATLNLSIVLDLDSSRGESGRSRRLYFVDKTTTMTRNLLLKTSPNTPWTLKHCIDNIQVIAAPSIVDPLAPVNVTLKIASRVGVTPLDALLLNVPAGGGQLKALEPIVHPDNLTHVWQLEFERDCGDDYNCVTDLAVRAEFGKATEEGIMTQGDGVYDYVRGISTAESLTLTVHVSNTGEPAYDAKLYVAYTPGLSFRSTPATNIKCEQQQQVLPKDAFGVEATTAFPVDPTKRVDLMVVCGIGSPFPPQGWTGSVDFIFDVTRALSQRERFTVSVNSSSKEQNPIDDKVVVQLNVYTLSRLMLSSASQPEQLNYSTTAAIIGESAMTYLDEAGPALEHVFVVENAGPAAVRGLSLHVAWPAQQDCPNTLCDRLLYLAEEIVVVGGGGGSCDASRDVNPARLQQRPEKLLKVSQQRTRRSPFRGGSSLSYSLSYSENAESMKALCRSNPRLRELQHKVRCETSLCRLSRLEPGQRTRITVRFRIWQATLVKNFDSASLLVLSSMARLDHATNIRPHTESMLETSANTEVYTISTATAALFLPAWTITVLSVAIGLLIVLMLILVLYCCGFFKRNQRPPALTAKVEQQHAYPYAPVPQDIFDSSRL